MSAQPWFVVPDVDGRVHTVGPAHLVIAPGMRLLWLYEPRGGYGACIRVPVTVRRATARRALVSAALRNGETKDVWVTRGHLLDHGL